MEESAEVEARLERIGTLAREGASRPELLAAIRGLVAAGVKSSGHTSDEVAPAAAPDGEAPSRGGTAPGQDAASSTLVCEEGTAVS